MPKERLLIRHKWALGDTVLLSGLVRDIHRAYPDKYEIDVDTHFTNVWQNNPHITRFDRHPGPSPLRVEVGWGDAIRWNGYARYRDRREMRHILAWYHYDFEQKTGIHVPVTDPRPDLHLAANELEPRVQGRYWVILSGGKLDMTVKHWHAHRAQEVVDKLAARGIHCVQVGAVHASHIHPPLRGTTNLIGQTENARDLWNIILHADGVICGVTAAMHIAAAYEKPCVVYAGGREEPWFEGYVNAFQAFGPEANPVRVEHKFLHTIGLLDCCDKQGCWKRRTVPLDPEDLTKKAYTLCRQPIRPETGHAVPGCLDLILSDHVVEAVMDYYDKNLLPPIGTPRRFDSGVPQVEHVAVRSGEVAPAETPRLVREPSTEIRVQQAYQQVQPLELKSSGVGRIQRALPIMDNPIIGGKFTICVLCYGDYPELARKSIGSILETVPADRVDLRIAANACSRATLDYLKTVPASAVYISSENDYKYPMMRRMFWNPQRPITTNYVIWFDDDTWTVQPHWIDNLAKTIIEGHPKGCRMYGSLMYHDLGEYGDARPDLWFRESDWYRGRHFRVRGQQKEAPNGSVIDFAVGWCWALATETIRAANIPDVRLQHNGGDITIGEQVHQVGAKIAQWNGGKSLVACPSREQGGRRGFSQRFPWDPNR